MKSWLMPVLLLGFLLVSLTEQTWRSRSLYDTRRVYGRRDWGTRYVRARALTKRDADDNPANPCANMDMDKAKKALSDLALTCPQFAIDPSVGLSKDAVDEAFGAADADNDNKLNEKELDQFEEVLEAYEVCAEETKIDQQEPVNDEAGTVYDDEMPANDDEGTVYDDEMPANDDEGTVYDDEMPANDDEGTVYDDEMPANDDEGTVYDDEMPANDDEGTVYDDEMPANDDEGTVYDDEMPANDDEGPVYDDEMPANDDEMQLNDDALSPEEEEDA